MEGGSRIWKVEEIRWKQKKCEFSESYNIYMQNCNHYNQHKQLRWEAFLHILQIIWTWKCLITNFKVKAQRYIYVWSMTFWLCCLSISIFKIHSISLKNTLAVTAGNKLTTIINKTTAKPSSTFETVQRECGLEKSYLCQVDLCPLRWRNQKDRLGVWWAPGGGTHQEKPEWPGRLDAPFWRQVCLQHSGPCEAPAEGYQGCNRRYLVISVTIFTWIFVSLFFSETYLGARPYGICTSPNIVARSVLLSKLWTEEALRSWASGST